LGEGIFSGAKTLTVFWNQTTSRQKWQHRGTVMQLPADVLFELEKTLEGLRFAKVNLEVVFHDGKPKFRIIVERSIVPGVNTSGGASYNGEALCHAG
jgi:hypothetical protein